MSTAAASNGRSITFAIDASYVIKQHAATWMKHSHEESFANTARSYQIGENRCVFVSPIP
jgi:hypothetical protein